MKHLGKILAGIGLGLILYGCAKSNVISPYSTPKDAVIYSQRIEKIDELTKSGQYDKNAAIDSVCEGTSLKTTGRGVITDEEELQRCWDWFYFQKYP